MNVPDHGLAVFATINIPATAGFFAIQYAEKKCSDGG